MDKALPPVAVLYHFIIVPVADRFEIVGLVIEQKSCDVSPVGAEVGVMKIISVP